MDENEAAYLSWFYSKKLDSEWDIAKMPDKQKKQLEDKVDNKQNERTG